MDPDGLLSRIAPYAACCIVSALVFLILGWAAAKKGARLPAGSPPWPTGWEGWAIRRPSPRNSCWTWWTMRVSRRSSTMTRPK